MNCKKFTAVIAKYGMLRNMKEASQFLAFFPDFPLLLYEKQKRMKLMSK